MTFPSTLRMKTFNVYVGFSHISSLWIEDLRSVKSMSANSPKSQDLKVDLDPSQPLELDPLFDMLNQRKDNVEARLDVDGIKMEPLKKLIVPFDRLAVRDVNKVEGLVEMMVDLALEPKFWEVEI